MSTSSVRGAPVAARLTLAAGVLLPFSFLLGDAAVERLLPAYQVVFEHLGDEYQVVRFSLDREGADLVVRAEIALRPVIVIRDKALTPDPRGRANASTLAANGLLAPLLALLTAFVWPAHRPVEYLVRLAIATPLLAVLMLLDTPSVLAGELWQLVLDRVAPGSFSPLVMWKEFLQSGGRQSLGIAVGLLAVAAGPSLRSASA